MAQRRGEPEPPSFVLDPAAVPLVGPRKHERARTALGERAAYLPVDAFRLGRFALAAGIEADLGHDEGAFPREILQPSEVGFEPLARLEVNVEAREVQKGKVEVFGGRKIDVGDQRLRILRLGRFVESPHEALDAPAPVPAHDAGRNFVAGRVAEQSGMPGALRGGRAPARLDLGRAARNVEEGDVLLPGRSRHDVKAVALRLVEEQARRYRIDAHRIDAGGLHRGEIGAQPGSPGIAGAVLAGTERAVGDALYPKLLFARIQKLPGDA